MANCFANCVIRTPAVDAPRTTDNMVEPDADIIAELMEQVHQRPYDYPMDILNLLNYPDENTVTFLLIKNEIVAHIFLPKRNKDKVLKPKRMMIAESRRESGCVRQMPLYNVLDLFIIQQAGDQSEHLAMVRKLWNAVECSGQAWNRKTSSNDSAQLFFPQVASSF